MTFLRNVTYQHPYQQNILLLIVGLLVFFGGCFSGESEHANIKNIEIEEATLLFPSDSLAYIGAPSEMAAVPGGFLLYDYGNENVHKISHDGNLLLTFGEAGRGPGEYQNVFGMWQLKEGFLVFDYTSAKLIVYNRKGKVREDIPLKFKEFPRRPVRIEVLQKHMFVYPVFGKNGKLMAKVDLDRDKITYFGNAVVPYDDLNTVGQYHQAILAGKIPAEYKNLILISHNKTGLYAFQTTTGVLEKYSFSGELIWDIHINTIPATDGLLEDILKKNQQQIKNGMPTTPALAYAKYIDSNPKGIALLLNLFEEQPTTVVWVPNHGKHLAVISYPGVKNSRYQSFTVAEDGSWIYFVNAIDGELYQAEWPVE